MKITLIYIIIGYLSGSILFANIAARVFDKPEILEDSIDGNPGVANAFQYGGFLPGVFTLCGDLAKGFIPVFLYFHRYGQIAVPFLCSLVIAAPVIGHIFPLYRNFHGGKGITVTFGCLLGLLPLLSPVIVFAGAFLFYSLVLRITPHFHRTIVSYLSSAAGMFVFHLGIAVTVGFILITIAVMIRFRLSEEKRAKPEVRLLWMH